MKKSDLQIKEISIVLAAQNHNPSILNADFLKFNDIIPAEWQLKEPPVCIFPFAQVIYDNGVKITSQLEKVVFLEQMADSCEKKLSIASLACKYVEKVPHGCATNL
ncbi:MAG TPA: hypothetical protein VJ440_02455 [Candidatus Brocadiaceae bacterium]|nr:hypothetical protein [Candidatus Brocadiaceae bacterium]